MTNQFQLLVGPEAFIQSLQNDLPNCNQNFYVQFSTFEGDASGKAFADLLLDKARAEIDVRLVVDYYSDAVLSDTYPILIHRRNAVNKERQETLRLFEDIQKQGVKVKRTAPMGPAWIYALYRDHKKMIILDDDIAYVGGINISDHNYAWHDYMVRIEGSLVQNLKTDYCSSWDGETTPFDKPHSDANSDFILNQCAGRYSIFEEILAMIGRAEEEIIIESPYLLGDNIESAILNAAERGVKARLIIPYQSNKLVYRIWIRASLRRLNHPNITYYGYHGEHDMTHAKLVIVDGKHATFGSLNMFELEGLTQKELNVFSSNPDFITQLKAFVESDIAESTRLATPRYGFGRFTYTLAYNFFKWWTGRLVRNPKWKAIYC